MSKKFKKGKESIPSKASINKAITVLETVFCSKDLLEERLYDFVENRLKFRSKDETVSELFWVFWRKIDKGSIFLGDEIQEAFRIGIADYVCKVQEEGFVADIGDSRSLIKAGCSVLVSFYTDGNYARLTVYAT